MAFFWATFQFCLLIKHSDQFLESAVKGTPFNTVTMVYNFLSLCDGQPRITWRFTQITQASAFSFVSPKIPLP